MPVTQNTAKQNYLLQHSARTQDWLILHLQIQCSRAHTELPVDNSRKS